MSTAKAVPALSGEQSLNRYLSEIKKYPVLTAEQEYMLAKRYEEHEDPEAASQLVSSHLRLVAKIAMGYRGYGLPQAEVISEANVGLMQAVKRFDPEKGFRLATYAMWWIRASIQEYILRSWSLVKLGTTSAQKKLFFNLRKAKNKIGALEEGELRPENVARIATDLGVTEAEVVSMNRRLSGGDASLNAMVGSAEGDSATQWQDWLEDEDADQQGEDDRGFAQRRHERDRRLGEGPSYDGVGYEGGRTAGKQYAQAGTRDGAQRPRRADDEVKRHQRAIADRKPAIVA